MPSALSHLFIRTRDLARSTEFWLALGLDMLVSDGGYIRIGGGGGFHFGLEGLRDGAEALAQRPPGEPPLAQRSPSEPEMEVVVRVDDVDATCTRLRAAGFTIVRGPTQTEWGTYHAWTTDPDGRSVSFCQSEDEE